MSSEKPMDDSKLSESLEESKLDASEQEVIVVNEHGNELCTDKKQQSGKPDDDVIIIQRGQSEDHLEALENKVDDSTEEVIVIDPAEQKTDAKEEQAATHLSPEQDLETVSACGSDAHDFEAPAPTANQQQNANVDEKQPDANVDEKQPDAKVDDQDNQPEVDDEKEVPPSESEESEPVDTVDILSKADIEQVLDTALEVTENVKLYDSRIPSRYEQPSNQRQKRRHNILPEQVKEVPKLLRKLQGQHNNSDLVDALEAVLKSLPTEVENPKATSEEDSKEEHILTIDRSTEEWKKKVLAVDGTEQIMTAAGFTINESVGHWEMKKEKYEPEKVKIIEGLVRTTIEKCSADGGNSYSSQGVTLKVLQTMLQKWEQSENKESKEEENEQKSSPGERFVQSMIVPKTKDANCSFAEVLKNTGEDVENIGKANVYICHPRQAEFKSLVRAIENYEKRQNDNCTRYYFLDYIAVNQNDQQAAQSVIESLEDILDDVMEFVLVVTRWDSPIALNRAWCLFEMASASCSDVKFTVSMPEEQHNLFRNALRTTSDILAVSKVFQKLNIDQAKTSVPQDYKAIVEKVEKSFESTQEFNSVLSTFLRFWFERTIEKLYSTLPEDFDSNTKLKFLEQLSLYFFKYGSPKAIDYHKRYIELSTQLYSAVHLNTLMMNVRLAMALVNMGKYSEVLAPLRTAIKGAKETLDGDPEEAHSKYMLFWVSILVTVLSKTDIKKAIKLEREVSRARQKLGEPRDRQLKELHKVCKVAKSEKFDEALKPLEELLLRVISFKGETAPLTMRTRKNLAHLYTALNKHEEALKVQDDFLKFATDRYGESSLHVLNLKNMQAKTLVKLERHSKASEMYKEVIMLGTKRFGEDHRVVEDARKGVATMSGDTKEEEKQ